MNAGGKEDECAQGPGSSFEGTISLQGIVDVSWGPEAAYRIGTAILMLGLIGMILVCVPLIAISRIINEYIAPTMMAGQPVMQTAYGTYAPIGGAPYAMYTPVYQPQQQQYYAAQPQPQYNDNVKA